MSTKYETLIPKAVQYKKDNFKQIATEEMCHQALKKLKNNNTRNSNKREKREKCFS